VWSATRETTAPHRYIHDYLCIQASHGNGVYQTRKYQHESEKSVQESKRVLISIIRKNAYVDQIAAITNALRKALAIRAINISSRDTIFIVKYRLLR